MCVYCNMGDWQFRYDPPFEWDGNPLIPKPINPVIPWDLEKLKEYEKLLRSIKELEDQIGCPCEPNKADYLKLLADRITALEKKGLQDPPGCNHDDANK